MQGFPGWESWRPRDYSEHLSVVFFSGFSNWFIFLEEYMASRRLTVIQEPEELNVCKHSLNAGMLVSGSFSGMGSLPEILDMKGCSIAKTGLSRF